jgi:(1->4)-alpha-D-glucan 1-alpha-D-glucosylmutase
MDWSGCRHTACNEAGNSVPVATYRLQLSRTLPFMSAKALVPYLDALGISDAYLSPILAAGQNSTHGYDISNHAELNPELGTREELRALGEALAAREMGLVVDFVPNHMGNDPRTNAWWWDVLENGPGSPYARYFDIDWLPVKPELRDKVLLPILGDQYGAVLERGELQLCFRDGALVLIYFDRVLPINPRQAPLVLGHGIDRLTETLGADHTDLLAFRAVLTKLLALPPMGDTAPAAGELRQRQREDARVELAELVARSPAIGAHVASAIDAFTGEVGRPATFDRLHGLLEVQAYRLAYWRTAFDEINYRRFFDINDLAGLRMEDSRVFDATHALLLDLVAEGTVTGIRLDHPDGLFDPASYLSQLRDAVDDRTPAGRDRVYIVVEKILAHGERLRDGWPVQGTTGYNALNAINGVFIKPDGLSELRRAYRQFTSYRARAADTIYASKRFMMRSAMASELNILTRALNRLSEGERRFRDFTLNGLRRALTEVIACFPVYRTYVTAAGAGADDAAVVDAAIAEARRRNPVQEPSIFEFIRLALLPGDNGDRPDAPTHDLRVAFAHKFQQYTAPVVAKGLEDTAFYNDVLLVSANEVGGHLRHRTRTIAALHESNRQRLGQWPLELTAGSTHDTKWGEDARARINVLSELPHDWRVHVKRWSSINEASRNGNGMAPDRNDEWLFYQALVGVWPAEQADSPVPRRASDALVARLQCYMRKALKEAKRHTGWLHENRGYEAAVDAFVDKVLRGDHAADFLRSFVPFQRRVAWFGMLNSLSQLLIRLASPGVPDIYQGSELWNFSMVDPDNRQPVDFACRRRMLSALEPLLDSVCDMHITPLREQVIDDRVRATGRLLASMLEQWPDGRVKLFTMAAALRFRRAHPSLFLTGEYEELGSDAHDPHLVSFSRRNAEREVVVVVPRFVATLLTGAPVLPFGMEHWRAASIPLPRRLAGARLVNIFTGEVAEPVAYRDESWLLAGSVFQSWPVAMFVVV